MNREFIISGWERERDRTKKAPRQKEGTKREGGESHFLSLDIYDTAAADF